MCDIEVKVRDHLEEEGGAQVTGRKSEQADEGDQRHGGSPPGLLGLKTSLIKLPDHPALGVGGYGLDESSGGEDAKEQDEGKQDKEGGVERWTRTQVPK